LQTYKQTANTHILYSDCRL